MNKNKVVMILSFILIFISILNPLLINVYASNIDKADQPYNDKESNIIENYNTNIIVNTNEKNQLNDNKNSIDHEHSINIVNTSNIND